jgi:hypothetical protein
MDDWTQPSRRRTSPREDDPFAGWKGRVAAAVAAPPIFCVSLLIVSLPLRFLGITLAMSVMSVVGFVAAIAGACLGLDRLPDFLGNVFLTNRAEDRKPAVFAAYWGAVVAVLLVSAWLSRR